MDSSKLVSVIIPVYNVAPFLQEALDSVIHQTYNNIEIIIIDDGSTDGSGEICDEYAGRDPRIYVIHQENRGLSAARNAGLDAMKGDAVAFLDSDDAYCPDFIEKMIAAMIRDNAEMVICRWTTQKTTERMHKDENEKEASSIDGRDFERAAALCALADGKIGHIIWNKLYLRKLWDDIRFPEGYVYEDIIITYQLINRCQKVYMLDRSLYMYRKRPGSINDIKSSKNITDYFIARSRFEEFIQANIPSVFTYEQLKRFRWKSYLLRIKNYADYSPDIEENENAFRKEMKKQILAAGQRMGIGEHGLRYRISYLIVSYCPGLVKIACSAYRFFRRRAC